MLVIANAEGKVSGHDLTTGEELWVYEDEDSVFLSTPASFVRPIFVTSTTHAHLIDSNGRLIAKRKLLGFSQSSFALSANLAYLCTSQGLFTFDFDLSSSFTVDGDGLNLASTPAIGDDGTVYVATDNGTLRAYSPVIGSIQFNFQTVTLNEPGEGAVLTASEFTVFSAEVSSPSSDGFDGEVTFSSVIDVDLCATEGT